MTDDGIEWIDEVAKEPFCEGRSGRNPREMVVSLTGTGSTAMWG